MRTRCLLTQVLTRAFTPIQTPTQCLISLVLPESIEHSTSPLPRGCSTTELRQQDAQKISRANAAETATRTPGRASNGSGWQHGATSLIIGHDAPAQGKQVQANC